MSGPREVVIGLDGAWGGTGWAVCTEEGPWEWGWALPEGAWKWTRLESMIRELSRLASGVQIATDAEAIRIVVERTPLHHGGVGGKGDPRIVVRAISELVGGSARGIPGFAYPWILEPKEWRAWWGLRGARHVLKYHAIQTVGALWPDVRAGLDALEDQDRAGDVAEAILIGVGAARHASGAPAGPARAGKPVLHSMGEATR